MNSIQQPAETTVCENINISNTTATTAATAPTIINNQISICHMSIAKKQAEATIITFC